MKAMSLPGTPTLIAFNQADSRIAVIRPDGGKARRLLRYIRGVPLAIAERQTSHFHVGICLQPDAAASAVCRDGGRAHPAPSQRFMH